MCCEYRLVFRCMQHPKAGQNTQHVLINIDWKKYQFAVNQRLAVSDPNFFLPKWALLPWSER